MRGLMNSWAPISGLVCPSLARRAICASWGVRTSRVSSVRLRAVSPVARSSRRARSANASAPMRLKQSWAARSCSRASTRRFSRRSHSPYSELGAGELDGDPAAREPLDRLAVEGLGVVALAQQRARPAPRSRAPNRCRPRACARSAVRSAAAASSGAPLRAPASTSSTRDQPKSPRSSCSHASLGGRERSLVAAEAVVQHAVGHEPASADRPPLASRGRVLEAGLDQLERLGLGAAPRGEQQRRVLKVRVAGRLGDRVGLLDQRRGGGEARRRARAPPRGR